MYLTLHRCQSTDAPYYYFLMNDVARQQLSADSRVLAITANDVNDTTADEKMPFRACAETREKCRPDGTNFSAQ